MARGNAALALGMIKDPGAIEALKGAFNDPDEDVRKQAEKALKDIEITQDPSTEISEDYNPFRKNVCKMTEEEVQKSKGSVSPNS